MKRLVLLSILIVYANCLCIAQDGVSQSKSKVHLSAFVGYGTENNWGNTAFFAGISFSRPVKKHFFLDAGITRFTTDIYNLYKAKPPNIDNEDRKYNAWFLTTNINYLIGKEGSLLNARIKVGPSLKYYHYKVFGGAQIILYPDGRREAVPGTLKYQEKDGFNLSLYNSVNFDAKILPALRIGIFLDVYSALIPLEHFNPGINASFKIGR